MAVRIGANPIGWSNDDMRELGGATPLEVCLAEAKEAGFEGMELGHKFPREPKTLAQVSDLQRWLGTDEVVEDVCDLIEDLRTPLYEALEDLRSQLAA